MKDSYNQITVSVFMTTYYHEKYIAQALESVLKQKVNFEYEIIISDDDSKDKTQEIILEYSRKYSCIRYIFNNTNIGLTNNVYQAKCSCRGKYIIQLSGDDYWIDDYKLQKQYDFLENHKDYIGVGTRIEIRTNESEKADYVTPKLNICERAFCLSDYLKGINFPLNGFMLRNCLDENKELFSLMPKFSKYIDDETDCFLILFLGKVFILKDATVAYRCRIEQEDEHNFNSINKGLDKLRKQLELLNNCYNYFGDRYDFYNRYKVALGPDIIKFYRRSTIKQFNELINTIPNEYKKRRIVLNSLIYGVKKGIRILFR